MDQINLGGAQRLILALALPQVVVEAPHQLDGRFIGDAPQRGDDGAGAGELEGAGEADQALAAQLLAEPRVAGREGDEVGVQAQALEDLPGLEETVVLPRCGVLGEGEGKGAGMRGDRVSCRGSDTDGP